VNYEEWANEDCLICGKHHPIGHVVVRSGSSKRAGRICAEHTLREIILDSQERFLVEIELTTEGVNAMERVYEKHKAKRTK
jgi:hypothetical protein